MINSFRPIALARYKPLGIKTRDMTSIMHRDHIYVSKLNNREYWLVRWFPVVELVNINGAHIFKSEQEFVREFERKI